MSDIEQKIDELREQVRLNLSERDTVFHSLGEFLLSQSPEVQESGLLEEQRSTAEAHSTAIPRLEEQLGEIDQCVEDLQSVKETEVDLKGRKAICKESLDQLQESLGEELYHQMNAMDSSLWGSAYQPVTDHINKLRDNESELYQIENQVSKKNLFNNMVAKSRISLLKSRKKTMETSMTKLYKKSFADALVLGVGKNGEDTPDGKLLIPWFRTEEEWKNILQEEESLENKKRLSKDHLKELCEGKGPKKRKEALVREIDREKDLLKDSLIKWGEGVCGNISENLSKLPEVIDAMERIDALTEAGVALNLEIEKWDAKKDIDRLENDKEYMTQKIASLEEEILARRQEIKVLKKDIAKVSKDIEKKQTFSADLPE
jgi:hypothetical protein